MCGIFGIITKRDDMPIAQLIREGLQRLEYRGYDSCGLAMSNNGVIEVRKEAGKIAKINENGWFDEMQGQFGMGHTRWANSRSSYSEKFPSSLRL